MSWITLTAKNIRGRVARGESDDYVEAGDQASDDPADSVDTIAEIIYQVTTMVRGKVAACRDNIQKMGPPGTIPEELLMAACTIARSMLIGSIPLSEAETKTRTEELAQANRDLSDVAACKFRIADNTGSLPELAIDYTTSTGGDAVLFW